MTLACPYCLEPVDEGRRRCPACRADWSDPLVESTLARLAEERTAQCGCCAESVHRLAVRCARCGSDPRESQAMRAPSVGEEVLAPWSEDGFLYPCVLVHVHEETADLAFLDGSLASMAVADLRAVRIGAGSQGEVNWRGSGQFYGGTIVRRRGLAVCVHFDDGTREWSTIAQCRVH